MSIDNLGEFDKWINRNVKKLTDEQVPLFVKRISLDLFRRLILKSPVGNPSLWQNPASAPPGYVGGRFRGNWQVDTKLNRDDLDDPGRNSTGSGDVAGIANANIANGGTVWIFNNSPYASEIENGHSGQAPKGVLAVSIAEITAANF